MKTNFLAFATLVLQASGLRVADPDVNQPDPTKILIDKAIHLEQEQAGILTYNVSTETWIGSLLSGDKPMATGKSIFMRAHRRSGIQLAKNVSNCIAKHADPNDIARVVLFPRQLEGDFTDTNLAAAATSNTPTLHFVRNPVEWIISWYQYVKQQKRFENA